MNGGVAETSEAETNRARLYGLLAALLARPPGADLLRALATVRGGAGELGTALDELAAAAASADAEEVRREYEHLFIGLVRGEVVPYASYYRTGFLQDRPLIAVRADFAELGLARADTASEPEDHISALLEAMAVLIDGRYGVGAGEEGQRAFFERHIAPFAGAFFSDLQAADEADFYRPVGALGAVLMDIEADAFAAG